MVLTKYNYELRDAIQTTDFGKADVHEDPIMQFKEWYLQADQCKIEEYNAMTLATATTDGVPNCRIVLLKGIMDTGFEFYTNYQSKKAKELHENPKASINFFWKEIQRQVRILGKVVKLPEERSDAYFESRPRGSQIGAWASDQSKVIHDRGQLMDQVAQVESRFVTKSVDRPPHWGGYLLQPHYMEFWQGRQNRLHDRICYTKVDENWKIERLSP